MDWNHIEGNWPRINDQVHQRWGKLTDDDLLRVGGQQEKLVERIQVRYGVPREEAERQVSVWAGKAPESWFRARWPSA